MKYMDKYYPKLKATTNELATAFAFGAVPSTLGGYDNIHNRLLGAMRLVDNCETFESIKAVAKYCTQLVKDLHERDFRDQYASGWNMVFNYKTLGKLMELEKGTK